MNGKKSGSVILKILVVIGAALLAIILLLVILFWNELRSLMSLEQVDEYGMYQMTYYGDYGFDEFLKTGAKSDADIETFVTKRLLKGLPIDLGVTGDGCTAFVTHNEKGDILFGRNFDFDYAPSLQLYTKPDHGYASVSTVNLAFAGYTADYLPSGLNFDSFLTLAAPFLPFDGMNEKGVTIALLAVPEAEPAYEPDRVTLNTTTAIRLVLDQAATTEEAIELLRQYNIYFSADVTCHYLISDTDGHAVIVEYYDHDLKVVESDEDYLIASNFIAYNDLNIGEGFTEFERYDAVKEAIEENGGKLEEEQAIDLLAQIGVISKETDKLQWTVLYNLTTGDGQIFAHRKTDQRLNFHLDLE
ncbi:MAG: linear amide C-N hydrolase [Clostridia bacterium]|nr:linear amide C-N hydrolase [Clostridia bacterium]